jgi:hypothetical protein
MDVVGSITSITAKVMRRLADAVEQVPAMPPQPVIHIHIYGDTVAPAPRSRWGKR